MKREFKTYLYIYNIKLIELNTIYLFIFEKQQ